MSRQGGRLVKLAKPCQAPTKAGMQTLSRLKKGYKVIAGPWPTHKVAQVSLKPIWKSYRQWQAYKEISYYPPAGTTYSVK